ncbi:TIR domain-containing protein [Nesterenkonia aurantiaca]|uniref:TIR-like protein DUF1863 n=1 Tax=Nesterenkonia aurantiaca TaxID=1436010 RepID=A0A4R7G422_9MICC|nr:TIR domain-containing protein [Nesterenkonia aurantiaca]TDS85870.1 TIR-like protein DUF1863 [Nesterenkonia aurantiaca]
MPVEQPDALVEKLQVHLASSVQLEDIPKTWISARRWENLKSSGDSALATLVLNGLKHTAVTAVLIGPETAHREWMQYEIRSTLKRGNGLLGIYIHNISDQDGRTAPQRPKPVAARHPTYDRVFDHGNHNLGKWVQEVHYSP